MFILEYLVCSLNLKKCVVKLRRVCKFLGININSSEMTLELPLEKRRNIKLSVDGILKDKAVTIHKLSQCIGVMITACPTVAVGCIVNLWKN